MLAPQSDAEVGPVREALQRLDTRLDVRWEPRAVMTKRGGYDAGGKVLDPVYDGRWEVILHDTSAKTADWRAWTRICLVTEPVRVAAGVQAMQADGPYAPLGPWLVALLQAADAWNHDQARRLRERLDAMNDAADEATLRGDEAGEVEAAERQYIEGTIRGGVSQLHPVRVDLRAPLPTGV